MASLVEFQELKFNHHHVFPDTCDLQAFEDFLGGMDLPTPPLSPDHADETDSTQLTAQPEDDVDIGETILKQMISSTDDLLFDSQGTYGSEDSDTVDIDPSILACGNPQALLQDCMWNCDAYEPRHSISCNGVYTPAPSPPPEVKTIIEDEDHMPTFEAVPETKEMQEEMEEDEESIGSSQVSMVTATDSSRKDIRPKSCIKMERSESRKPTTLAYRRSSCNGSSRVHPQATTSESGKNIFSLLLQIFSCPFMDDMWFTKSPTMVATFLTVSFSLHRWRNWCGDHFWQTRQEAD